LASQTHDDGFHEIQLNGKQLVFLFMAATVVSVVIFLCGVLVGRGVRAERGVEAERTELAPPAPMPAALAETETATAGAPGSDTASPPAVDDLSYFNRLEQQAPLREELPAPGSRDTARAAAIPAPVAAAAPVERRAAAAGGAASQGYAVQLAALNSRTEAESMAKRLVTKGYAAYVLAPAGGTPAVYRVRVGTFPTRREAETVAERLEQEERFKPWVTR
jgi:cell division septation protein DedD